MCRHIAYVGEPAAIQQLVVDPPFGLYRQSWAPRQQQWGTVNVDGYGVGWYAEGDPMPARYRRSGPIWADASFADLARVVRTRALLAAVRSATPGCAEGEAAAAPFAAGPWLFSHNGVLPGWPHGLDPLVAKLPPSDLLSLEARSDSALVWALVLRELRDGATLGEALTRTVLEVTEYGPARLNLLLTDGAAIAATAWGDTLYYRARPGESVLVASEPDASEPGTSEPGGRAPGWTAVPDRSLLLATVTSVTVHPVE